jgi:hypothetical protein
MRWWERERRQKETEGGAGGGGVGSAGSVGSGGSGDTGGNHGGVGSVGAVGGEERQRTKQGSNAEVAENRKNAEGRHLLYGLLQGLTVPNTKVRANDLMPLFTGAVISADQDKHPVLNAAGEGSLVQRLYSCAENVTDPMPEADIVLCPLCYNETGTLLYESYIVVWCRAAGIECIVLSVLIPDTRYHIKTYPLTHPPSHPYHPIPTGHCRANADNCGGIKHGR